MKKVRYSIVRLVPDPARGELFNIGIILWDDEEFHLKIDQEAVKKAVSKNPIFAKNSFGALKENIEARMKRVGGSFETFINNQPGFPWMLSDLYITSIEDNHINSHLLILDKLFARLVERPKVPEEESLPDTLKERLKPLIELRKIFPDHPITSEKSSATRKIDYFVNSSQNVALDLFSLRSPKKQPLQTKADAEAFKIMDLIQDRKVSKYFVFCREINDKNQKMNESLMKILNSAGAELVKSEDEAVHILEQAANAS